MEQTVENSGKSSLGRRFKRLSLRPLVSPVDPSPDARKTADMSSSPSSCPNSPISPPTPMSASFPPIGHSVPHIASASISPIRSREEILPPTFNCMGPRQKNKLLKTTRKLYRILGSTPVLSDCEDSVPDSSCHSRSLSGRKRSPEERVRRQDSSASCVSRRSKRPFYFPLSPRPSLASLRPLSPPILKVDCSVVGNLQRHSSMSSASTRISVPQPSSAHSDDGATIVLDTPKHRRNKMAKLARYLGENIPIELVFPVARFSPSKQLESPVEMDAAEALQERFRSSLTDDRPRRNSESSRTDRSGSECNGELRRTQTMGIGRTRKTSQPISPLFDAPLQALQFGHNPSGLEENTDVMQVPCVLPPITTDGLRETGRGTETSCGSCPQTRGDLGVLEDLATITPSVSAEPEAEHMFDVSQEPFADETPFGNHRDDIIELEGDDEFDCTAPALLTLDFRQGFTPSGPSRRRDRPLMFPCPVEDARPFSSIHDPPFVVDYSTVTAPRARKPSFTPMINRIDTDITSPTSPTRRLSSDSTDEQQPARVRPKRMSKLSRYFGRGNESVDIPAHGYHEQMNPSLDRLSYVEDRSAQVLGQADVRVDRKGNMRRRPSDVHDILEKLRELRA